MPNEIERKFLVTSDHWREKADAGLAYRQGYIKTHGSCSVRIRLAGDKGFLTLKGKPTDTAPLTRSEYEYEIPPKEAADMLDTLCDTAQIEKTRYKLRHEEHIWEIDVFHGSNSGLVLAEVELSHEQEVFDRPNWLGTEVSTDPHYTNLALASHPMVKKQ